MADDILASRTTVRHYARLAQFYASIMAWDQARRYHMKASAALAVLQWRIEDAATPMFLRRQAI